LTTIQKKSTLQLRPKSRKNSRNIKTGKKKRRKGKKARIVTLKLNPSRRSSTNA